ncbi:MAG: VIT domain-containing protein [Pyrinomonadaceae bacterium]
MNRHFSKIPLILAGLLVMAVATLPFQRILAQTGVLIPSSVKNEADDQILSLGAMNVDVCIDNQHATVKVTQIFDNHTDQTLEGKYLYALPEKASVSDFAVWDADQRIPGVMLEKRRANEVYGEIKRKEIDPGILQQDDEHGGTSAFSAKVVPIPANGTKRLEMEYTEVLPVENLNTHFTFPLKPSGGARQMVSEFRLNVCVYNDFPISNLSFGQNPLPLKITKQNQQEFEAEFFARDFQLTDDFSIDYKINVPNSTLSFITYRAPEKISAYEIRDPGLAEKNPDGYFQAQAIFNEEISTGQKIPRSRRVVLMIDTSLSMYGEKLVRAVEASEYFLKSLTPADEFGLILFGNEPRAFSENSLPATPENVEKALEFIRNSNLGGGTDLLGVLQKGVDLSRNFSPGERDLILISDANPTIRTTEIGTFSKIFDQEGGVNQIKFFAFALGNDANLTLLRNLSNKTKGYFEQARETEDISLLLGNFLNKVGNPSIDNLRFLAGSGKENFYQVYATGENSFDGSGFSFVGRYKEPKEIETVALSALFGNRDMYFENYVKLPEFDDFHRHLPRLWARARIDALMREINRNGERSDYISEIISLSQKYKLVSPYTAFLAAPRALLRPRLIQPGDPVIRVRADQSIEKVFAVLPFGETLPLRFVEAEGIFEGRFFAPAWMPDGTYTCRLILTDKSGRGFEEKKTFVVDSRAPKIKINIPEKPFRGGDQIDIRVSADSDTARLTAKLYGAKPVQLFWSDAEKASTGKMTVPKNLSPGRYFLSVTAEDFAHNQTTEEVRLEILND